MSSLVSFVWDQSIFQERVEGDTIQNEKFLPQSGTRTHNLEMSSLIALVITLSVRLSVCLTFPAMPKLFITLTYFILLLQSLVPHEGLGG